MANRIFDVQLRDRSVIPAEAEVLVTVVPQMRTAGTQVKGRLMGPRCRYATTVEIAYHLRPSTAPTTGNDVALRVILPEACLWEPQSPHLYQGPIELWQEGQKVDVREIRHGLRQLQMGPRGLRVNGRPARLEGRRAEALEEFQAEQLRAAKVDLLVVPVREATRSIWELADRIGFFVLGEIVGDTPTTLLSSLARHPSCLGWILGETVPVPAPGLPAGTFLGVDGTISTAEADFVVMSADQAMRQPPSRPVLLRGDRVAEGHSESMTILGILKD